MPALRAVSSASEQPDPATAAARLVPSTEKLRRYVSPTGPSSALGSPAIVAAANAAVAAPNPLWSRRPVMVAVPLFLAPREGRDYGVSTVLRWGG